MRVFLYTEGITADNNNLVYNTNDTLYKLVMNNNNHLSLFLGFLFNLYLFMIEFNNYIKAAKKDDEEISYKNTFLLLISGYQHRFYDPHTKKDVAIKMKEVQNTHANKIKLGGIL
jgi:hypothetical protein